MRGDTEKRRVRWIVWSASEREHGGHREGRGGTQARGRRQARGKALPSLRTWAWARSLPPFGVRSGVYIASTLPHPENLKK